MTEQPPVKRRRTQRACDNCRQQRIRCDYDGVNQVCVHCATYGISCERNAPAPKDDRPRKARRHTTEEAEDLAQGVEPGYLGRSSLVNLVFAHCYQKSWKRRLSELDHEHDLYRDAFREGEPESGCLVGRMVPIDPAHGGTSACTFGKASAKLADKIGAQTILDDLLLKGRLHIIPFFPVVTVTESLGPQGPQEDYFRIWSVHNPDSAPPSAIPRVIRLILCAIPSLSRDVPPNIRKSVLNTVQGLLTGPEMSRISSPTLSNVQVLILLSLADELHAWDARGAESMAWRRIGTGLRMALELGLHRAVSSKVVPRPQRHRRQRVWGACVFADRWLSLRLGQPHTINLADADAPPPFPYPDHIDPAQSSTVVPSFQLFCELTRLSEFLGKACNLVCTPSWLERADDVSLLLWQNNFETWLEALPTDWRYDLRCLTEASQVLNTLVVTVMFTFYQSLIWPIRPIPSHITFRPPQRRKQDLIRRSQEVIIWAEGSGQFYIDTLSFIPYAVACCTLIQVKIYDETESLSTLQWLDRGIAVLASWADVETTNSQFRQGRQNLVEMLKVLRPVDPPVLSDPFEIFGPEFQLE